MMDTFSFRHFVIEYGSVVHKGISMLLDVGFKRIFQCFEQIDPTRVFKYMWNGCIEDFVV